MKRTDKIIEELVSKINKTEIKLSNTGEIINKFDNNQQLADYLKSEIQKCVLNADLTQALAIIDYSLHNTYITSKDLSFIYNDDTYLEGKEDFAIEFIGHCEALHYV